MRERDEQQFGGRVWERDRKWQTCWVYAFGCVESFA